MERGQRLSLAPTFPKIFWDWCDSDLPGVASGLLESGMRSKKWKGVDRPRG
jgi:hypothetical protein